MTSARRAALVLACTVGAASAGCLSATGYRVAQTLESGAVEGHVGLSVFAFEQDSGTGFSLAPSGSVRAGLGGGLEAAVLMSAQPRFAAELVYQLPLDLGPAHVAVAAGPFAGALPFESQEDQDDTVLGLDALALVDVWLQDRVVLVGFGGPTYAYAPGPGRGAGLIQFGGGVRLLATRHFGIHAESSTQWNPELGGAIDTAAGVGFIFGDVGRRRQAGVSKK